MANVMRVEGDMYVAGDISGRTTTLADNSVTNAKVASGAGIVATKVVQQRVITCGLDSTVDAIDQTCVAHVCRGAGTVTAFGAGHITALAGTEVCSVQCYINGVSCLMGAVALDNGDAARAVVDGTIDTEADDVAADDVIEVAFDWTTGDGDAGKGQFATVVLTETTWA